MLILEDKHNGIFNKYSKICNKVDGFIKKDFHTPK